MSTNLQVILVAVALALSGCTPVLSDPRPIVWSLEDDVGYFRQTYAQHPEMMYRVGELGAALQSEEYKAFAAAIERAPPASRAFVYYESAPNASHYLFVLAASDGERCTVTVSTMDGVRAFDCQRVPEYRANVPVDSRLIRDPGVAALVQFDPEGGEARRAISILPTDEPLLGTQDDELFDRVESIFG
jgi:hypothetical protein